MSVPTNLIPTLITGLQEYTGSSTLGYMPYILDGRTYKVQFANIAAVGAVPSSRVIAAGTGLAGGGDLSANRVISIANGGVGFDQLALSGVTQGTYGSGSAVPILTVDSKGRITSATTAPLDVTGFVPNTRTITAGDGLTGGGALTSNVTLAANFSAATPSALGTASAGTAITVSRGDHVHPAVNLSDTSQTQGALPLGRGGTGDALSPVAGAVVYSTGSKFALTNPGIAGQVLVSAGTDEPQWQTILGTGTVTSVSVSTANGFAGFVANPATVPDITLSTTVTGMLKGDGTGMSAATAGVDYVEPGPYTTSGLTMASARLLGRTTASVGAAQEITVGTGLTLSGGSLINAAPDQTVSLTAGTAISVTGTYPSFTVTNTAPDQVVSLTGAGTTTVTGTYPSFTITSNDSTSGTVTSVNASGGTTGMSFTGGPVTSAGTLTLNGTLAVANGGTGATDAATALTNLGAYPASNPAGYTTNVGTVTSVSGTGTVSGLSLSGTVTSAGSLTLGGTLAVLPSNFASQTANTVLAAPNGSAGVPTFRAIVAADVPTLNQNTTGTASNVTGIVAVANGGTGASVAGTARTNLGAAASGANTDITSIALTTGTISTSPTSGTDIVNKDYADSIASGINFHQSVRLATTAALSAYTYNNGTSGVGATITANANGALSIDGVAAVAGNRVLIKNESGAAEAYNGVYTVTQVGNGSTPYILTRATDFDSSGSGVDQIDAGDFFLVTAGSTLANTSWVQQTPLPITVGTTAIVFTQFGAPITYSAGTGLSLTGTTFSITNTGVSASTYGSASSVPVIAVNAQGQITSASASSIAIAASQITSGALAIANGGTGATDASGALSNLGAYPASNPSGFTSNTGTVTSVNLTAGTGVSVSGGPITASGSITVTNTAPDQVVSLTGSGATTVTGTYPNFTISSTAGGAGTVTSIDVSGGTTGLTTSGGPVTSSGTITLAGTLNVANGGTGATTLSSGYVLKGNGTSAVSASVIYDNGTNVGVGTTSPNSKFDVRGTINASDGTNGNVRAYVDATSAYLQSLNQAANAYQPLLIMGSTVAFANNGTTRMTLDTFGTLGLGTTTGGGKLNIKEGSTNFEVNTSGVSADLLAYDRGASAYKLLKFRGSEFTFNPGDVEKIRIDTVGNLGLNTTTPVGRLSVVSGSSTGVATGAWSNNYSVFGPNAGSTTGAAVALGYNSAIDAAEILALAPGVAWKPLNLYSAGLNLYASSGGIGASLNGSGTFSAVTDIRAPIFYDSDNTAFYVNPTSNSHLSELRIGTSSGDINQTGVIKENGATYGLGLFTWGDSAPIRIGGGSVNFAKEAGGILTVNFSSGSKVEGNGDIYARRDSGTTGVYYFVDGGSKYLYWDGGQYIYGNAGPVVAPTSFRAPIFYDSDNTGYYIDAAGTSTLYRTNGDGFAASQFLCGMTNYGDQVSASTWYGIGRSNVAGWTPGGMVQVAGYTGTRLRGAYSIIDIDGPLGGNIINFTTGSARFVGDVRAPLYYDSDNTAYYIDAAGTSVLRGLTLTDGSPAMTFSSTTSGRSAAFGMTDAYNMYLNAPSGGILYLSNFQAPIMYDRDNSGYYVDPASASNLNRLVIAARNDNYFVGSMTTVNAVADLQSLTNTFGQMTVMQCSPVTSLTNGPPDLYPYGAVMSWRTENHSYQFYAAHTGDIAYKTQWNNDNYSGWLTPIVYGRNGGSSSGKTVYGSVYYDSDSTGYFVNPATSSTLANLDVASVIDSALYYDSAIEIRERAFGGALTTSFNNAPRLTFHWGGRVAMQLALGSDNILNVMNGDCSGFTTLRAGDVYGNIFYDRENTAYFVNPNSNSAFAGALVIGPTGGGAYTRFGASAGDTTYSTISASNGNLHIDSQAGYDLYLNWYTARPVWSEGGAYFPIYYDRNDTAFYMNPNAGSRFQTIDVNDTIYSNNWFRSYGSTGWFNQSYAGGIFMQDTTWVRVYNGKAFYVPNEIAATGNITAYYSDERLKTKTGGIDNALEKLSGLSGFLYVENDLARSLGYSNDKQQVGVSAQAVQAVLPEAVSLAPVDFETLEDGTIVSKSGENYLTVDYSRLVPLLIEAIKELTDKVKALEAKEQ